MLSESGIRSSGLLPFFSALFGSFTLESIGLFSHTAEVLNEKSRGGQRASIKFDPLESRGFVGKVGPEEGRCFAIGLLLGCTMLTAGIGFLDCVGFKVDLSSEIASAEECFCCADSRDLSAW